MNEEDRYIIGCDPAFGKDETFYSLNEPMKELKEKLLELKRKRDRIFLRDFIDHLDLWLDQDWLNAKIETYLNERNY